MLSTHAITDGRLLDQLGELLAYKLSPGSHDLSHYSITTELEYAKHRVSLEALRRLMASDGDRSEPGPDQNRIELMLGEGHPERLALTATRSFQEAGLIASGESLETKSVGYYRSGCYVGWHTNSQPGGRQICCSHCGVLGASSFLYFFEEKSQHRRFVLDDKGWNFRMFDTGPNEGLWHASYSECDRLSVRFELRK